MNVDEFEDTVTERTDLETRDETLTAADAVLRTLSDRVSRGAAADFADHLPSSLAGAIQTAESREPETFGPDGFVERVAHRERERTVLDADAADEHVRAVFAGLDLAVNEQAWHDLRAQLPGDYGDLFEFDRDRSTPAR